MKEKVKAYIESIKDELITLSHNIHANPEISFTEYKSSAFIVEVLRNHGFEVEYPYANVETAFKATKKGKGEGPKIAILAEYDALPEIGHACGHNVIATCSTGAFLALSEIMDNYDGEIAIIGTPAEEGGGGKIHILNNGGFDGYEYALMMHPSSGERGLVNRGGRAATSVYVEFFGKAVHSSAPAHGINALNAMIKLFNNIDMMRPTFHPQNNVNGIIEKGGSAANAIPDYTKAHFSLRAETLIELKKLAECIKKCAQNAADFVGAKYEVTVGDMYAERYPNLQCVLLSRLTVKNSVCLWTLQSQAECTAPPISAMFPSRCLQSTTTSHFATTVFQAITELIQSRPTSHAQTQSVSSAQRLSQ